MSWAARADGAALDARQAVEALPCDSPMLALCRCLQAIEARVAEVVDELAASREQRRAEEVR